MTQLSQPSSRPGQMTAVMRAIDRPPGPRVLRAALVRGGKVIDERVLARRSPLTLGNSERSTFVVTGARLPAGFHLLDWSGNGYVLNLAPGIGGKIALASGTVDLREIRATSLEIAETTRGKITIGDATLLFHFVEQPAARPKASLPRSAKKGLFDDLDWGTTTIAAFSFLFHFGAVGSLYADFTDGVVDDHVDVGRVVETVKQLPVPPPLEHPKEAAADPSAKAEVAAKADAKGGGRGGSQGGFGGGGRSSADARAAALSRELAAMDAAMMLAIGGKSGATGRVLEDSGAPTGLLDGIAANAGGVGAGNVAGLNLGGAGGVVRPGAGGRGLPTGDVAAAGPQSAGSAVAVKKPVGGLVSLSAEPSGGVVSNAQQVVAAMRAGLRACYKHGLDIDPTMQGSVRVIATVGANGEVVSARPSGASGLSQEVVRCVTNRVSGAQFSAPQGGNATIVIPMSFRSQ